MSIFLLTLFALPVPAHSDQINIGFGPCLDSSNLQPHIGKVQYEKDLGNFALVVNAVGVFAGPTFGIFSVVPSLKVVTPEGIFMRAGVGVGYTTQVNARLSSPAQFNIETCGGLNYGWAEIGPCFDHWSNGSILGGGPNLGLDAAFLSAGVKF